MAILSSGGCFVHVYQDSLDPRDPQQVEESLLRLIAKLPTIAAYSYKKAFGQPFIYPDNSLDYCSNFLRMMFALPSEQYAADPDFVKGAKSIIYRSCGP